MEGDLQHLDTQLTELKNTSVNICGKVKNTRNLIDHEMASLKKELKELKVNSCLCEFNNYFKTPPHNTLYKGNSPCLSTRDSFYEPYSSPLQNIPAKLTCYLPIQISLF